jgi:prepilin-type N-terminal cleavage/methylation domain-containing protein
MHDVARPRITRETRSEGAFTLIEMAIVLVIIGLIVGGVLVGQDLIRAAAVRATIWQIEKYNTAVNTFRGKYDGLPGDLNASLAAQFGFSARGSSEGQGDGNGVIEGSQEAHCGFCAGTGEVGVFWVDLSQAGLIDGGFNTATETPTWPIVTGAALANWIPPAKLGGGNYIYVWSGGYGVGSTGSDGTNYFGISAIQEIGEWVYLAGPGLTIQQAYAIDTKIDDGLPQQGNITALFVEGTGANWSTGVIGGSGAAGAWPTNAPTTAATPGASTTCYDNGGVAGPQQYSVEQSGGSNINCALSFRFQ